jgi:site-specific DNA-cytosine methylase
MRVTLVIITGPCDRFCSYLRGKGVAMGSDDLSTKLLYMRVAAAILMRKFRVAILENIEAFSKSECFQMIKDACVEVGSRLIISPLNAWDLGSPFNRPRLFCYIVDKDVSSWCEDKFWQELEKSVHYESRTELQIKDMVITARKQREDYSMTDDHMTRLSSLSLNDKRKIAEATKHLKDGGREQWFAIDLSQEGWCKLHKTEGRLPTYTSSSRIFITHKSMRRCISPVECGIGMTMERIPLKVLCQVLCVHTKSGMRKLQVLLANLAQPSCMRVALDDLMIQCQMSLLAQHIGHRVVMAP